MYISMAECVRLSGGTPFKGVLHIGAHHGEEGQDYQNNGVERVFWFEANPEAYEVLHKKTEGLKLEQVYFSCCLSDTEEEIEFNVANNGQSSSMLKLGTHAKLYPHITYTKTISLKTKRFDSMVKEDGTIGIWKEKVSDFDFINLDVQGAELKVLKGFGDLLSTPSIRAIYTEVNSEEVYEGCCLVKDLDKYLKQFGFKRVATAAPEKAWGDSLYVRQ